MGKSLNELRDEALRIAVEHGFKDASIPEDVALMHSELSELLEDFRSGLLAHELQYETGHGRISAHARDRAREPGDESLFKPVGIPSEVADLIIRALHFSGKHGIDLEKAVTEKMSYNASRPFKHGGKKI